MAKANCWASDRTHVDGFSYSVSDYSPSYEEKSQLLHLLSRVQYEAPSDARSILKVTSSGGHIEGLLTINSREGRIEVRHSSTQFCDLLWVMTRSVLDQIKTWRQSLTVARPV